MSVVALRRIAMCCAALLVNLASTAAARAQADGLYVTVPVPLDSSGLAKIKNRVTEARSRPEHRPTTIVFDFNPGERDSGSPEFSVNYELADFIASLLDTTTVAYVHKKVSGHAVLPVLACKEIVCGPAGLLGEVVAAGEAAPTGIRANGYLEIVGKTRPAYLAIARKMLDANVRLRKGTKGKADWFLDLRERAAFEKAGGTLTDTGPLPAAPDGQVGLFSASQMRDLGLSNRVVESRQDLFDAFGLTAASLKEDTGTDRPTAAMRFVLRGQIDAGVREAAGRTVRDAIRRKTTILFLQLECAGGDLQAARDLAQDLRDLQGRGGDDGLRIVAFIPDKAPDTAAIVALGCTEIVMSKRKDATTAGGDPAPEAEFGDFEAALGRTSGPGAPNVAFWTTSLRELAEAQGYPPVLIDGMLNRNIEVLRVRKKDRSVRRLMTDAEYQQDRDRGAAAEWEREETIKSRGQLLKLSATRAEQLGLARFTVDTRDPADLYAKYGIDPAKVREAAPSSLDRFAEFLKIPAVTVLLVVIGFTGLILELKVPGTTVPGIVAALCFILVFWAHTQFSGQVAVLAGLLFVLGLILILLEVFVLPGIGAAGICGVLLMLAALGLVTFNEIPQTGDDWLRFGGRIATYLLGMIAAVGLAFLIARFLPNIPYANRLMLVPPGEKPGADVEPALPGAALAASLLGAVGTSVTVLRPAGTVRFGDQFIDVVTEGGFVPSGARVQVVEVEGTRIVVKEV